MTNKLIARNGRSNGDVKEDIRTERTNGEPTGTRNHFMITQKKLGPRAEHRQREGQRVKDSPTLSVKFPQLKSLRADLAYHDRGGPARATSMKYLVNLDGAKSVFRFDCPNCSCVGGDFDLSNELAKAVAARRVVVTGEVSCQGWRSQETISTERCLNVLRYKLSLSFGRAAKAA